MAKEQKNLLVGLDIGTSKVVALVGEMGIDGKIDLIGYGSAPSSGLKRGVIVNTDRAVEVIKRAVEEAELMAGCQIHSAFTGIADNQTHSINSHGIVAIRNQNEVMSYDVERVLDAAKAVAIPADQQIIHVLPKEFIIDRQEGIRQPIGMAGVRLESRVHMVIASTSTTQNIIKTVRRCELDVSHIILKQLAASYAILNEDEKELGICLIDIGAGTTDLVIFTQGAIQHTAVIAIGGDQVTNDIAIALRISTPQAEELKLNQGSALSQQVPIADQIELSQQQERQHKKISRKMLAEVIEPRYEELFGFIQAELVRTGFDRRLAAGIVLTGGAANMKGAIELAERVFGMPVRLGVSDQVRGLPDIVQNPAYSTAIGLLLFGVEQENMLRTDLHSHPSKRSMFGRVRQWLQGNF